MFTCWFKKKGTLADLIDKHLHVLISLIYLYDRRYIGEKKIEKTLELLLKISIWIDQKFI